MICPSRIYLAFMRSKRLLTFCARRSAHLKLIKGVNENLDKKLAASLSIAIFLMSTIAVLAPVQAHFTLGQNTPNYPFTQQNFDPHVTGVIGYVWPGGGENTYNGYPTTVNPLLSPGYVAPYPSKPSGNSALGLDSNVEQLDGDEYSPSGAIVVSSTGDLIFAINATGNTTTTDPVTGVRSVTACLRRTSMTDSTLQFHLSSKFQTPLNKSLQRSQTITRTLSPTQLTQTTDTYQDGL